jgi:hypothetical protein
MNWMIVRYTSIEGYTPQLSMMLTIRSSMVPEKKLRFKMDSARRERALEHAKNYNEKADDRKFGANNVERLLKHYSLLVPGKIHSAFDRNKKHRHQKNIIGRRTSLDLDPVGRCTLLVTASGRFKPPFPDAGNAISLILAIVGVR